MDGGGNLAKEVRKQGAVLDMHNLVSESLDVLFNKCMSKAQVVKDVFMLLGHTLHTHTISERLDL